MAASQRTSRCVFVGNIPYDTTEEQLHQICEEVGPVVSFRLVVDRDTGKPKGYGFCEYKDEETAQSARRNLQGYEINGRQLRVDYADNDKALALAEKTKSSPQSQSGYGTQYSQSSQNVSSTTQSQIGKSSGKSNSQQLPANPPSSAPTTDSTFGTSDSLSSAMAPNSTLSNQLAGMSKQQLYDLLSQMKILIQTNRTQARQILIANPQLTKALFQAQVMLGMVKPITVQQSTQSSSQQKGVQVSPPSTQRVAHSQQSASQTMMKQAPSQQISPPRAGSAQSMQRSLGIQQAQQQKSTPAYGSKYQQTQLAYGQSAYQRSALSGVSAQATSSSMKMMASGTSIAGMGGQMAGGSIQIPGSSTLQADTGRSYAGLHANQSAYGQSVTTSQTPQVTSMDIDQQKALLQQVMSLTPEQINMLPPEQQSQVIKLQQALK